MKNEFGDNKTKKFPGKYQISKIINFQSKVVTNFQYYKHGSIIFYIAKFMTKNVNIAKAKYMDINYCRQEYFNFDSFSIHRSVLDKQIRRYRNGSKQDANICINI